MAYRLHNNLARNNKSAIQH